MCCGITCSVCLNDITKSLARRGHDLGLISARAATNSNYLIVTAMASWHSVKLLGPTSASASRPLTYRSSKPTSSRGSSNLKDCDRAQADEPSLLAALTT